MLSQNLVLLSHNIRPHALVKKQDPICTCTNSAAKILMNHILQQKFSETSQKMQHVALNAYILMSNQYYRETAGSQP